MFKEKADMATKKALKNKGNLYFVTSGLLVAAMIAAAIYYAEPAGAPGQVLLDPAQRSGLTPESTPG
ncbi:MAG: hypothetical protein R3265_10585 [Hyphomonas sp.]|nr:hypothetical protein [Hyphomonas sp.]